MCGGMPPPPLWGYRMNDCVCGGGYGDIGWMIECVCVGGDIG